MKGKELQLLPVNSMKDLIDMGNMIAQSNMFGTNNPGAGFVIASTCHQQGLTFLEYQRTYHTFMGKPSMKADAMLAEFLRKGGEYTIISRTPELASIEMTFGKNKKKKFSFSWIEAQEQDYIYAKDQMKKPIADRVYKDNWNSPRKRMQMLWARLISDSTRVMDPTINAGLYTPEEMSDYMEPTKIVESKIVEDIQKVKESLNIKPETDADDFYKADDIIEEIPKNKTKPEDTIIDVKSEPGEDPWSINDKIDSDEAINPYSLCPFDGKCKGMKWDDMQIAWLEKAAKIKIGSNGMTQKHHDYVEKVISEILHMREALK